MADAARLRRLRTARVTGTVPADLVGWVLDLAEKAASALPGVEERSTPTERLSDALGDEIDRAMALRGATQRDLAVSRRTLTRALRGDNVTVATIAEIADALGCDVTIAFVERGVCGAKAGIDVRVPEAPAD